MALADGARRRDAILLLAILVLALGLRAYRLDAQSLWNDEGTSVALAGRDLATITRNAAHDIHPPLYYYLLHVWVRLAGASEWGARSLSVLLGAGVVLATYGLTRALVGRAPALLAALLAALSPFQVYYAQEARMYIGVTLWALLSTWALVRWVQTSAATAGTGGWRPVLLYVLTTTLALYTQYYAFAVLLAQNLAFAAWLAVSLREPMQRSAWPRRTLLWVAVQGSILLLYTPWLLLAWRSLRAWPAVSAPLSLGWLLSEVARVYALGLTVPEGLPMRLLGLALAAPIIPGLLWWFRRGRGDGRWGLWCAMLYLVVPVAAMYVLSLQRPMYKPKFLLLGTPPYYLLQACGIVAIGEWLGLRPSAGLARTGRRRLAAAGVTGALLLALVVPSLFSLQHLYFDPQYARDDYRGIVAYINATAGPDDAILINAPTQIETVGYYYRGALPLYPLPEQRPADPARTQATLERIAAQHTRLYAILWATGESDPQHLVEGWLDGHCFKAMDSWYGNVRLAVYAVPKSAQGSIEQHTDYVWGRQIRLRGYTLLTPQARSGDIVQVTLFWEALDAIPTRYKVFTHLVDGRGNIVGQRDSEPGGGMQPTSGWRPGTAVADNYGLLVPPGTPPGPHILRVGLYSLEDGRRLALTEGAQGDSIDLATLPLLPAPSPPPVSALDLQHHDDVTWDGLALLGHSLYRLGAESEPLSALRPGDVLRLILYWRKESPDPIGERVLVSLEDRRGHAVWQEGLPVTDAAFPYAAWRQGEVVRGIHSLFMPPELRPGSYRVLLRPDGWAGDRPYVLEEVTISP